MTITEPLGVSFLDGLFGAANSLNVFDYTKMVYYLMLTFTGYDKDGANGTNQIVMPEFKNGGQWLWALTPIKIETKINEGGGIYTLQFVIIETEALVIESKSFKTQSTVVVSGGTVGEILDDYAKKLTAAYTEGGKDRQGKPLTTFKINVTHKIPFGPYANDDISAYWLKPGKVGLSSLRSLTMEGKGGPDSKVTAHVNGIAINEFITSVIKSTERGESLVLDDPVPANVGTQPVRRIASQRCSPLNPWCGSRVSSGSLETASKRSRCM